MSGYATGRVTAILAAGALVAALATITLDAPADAAKPKCGGKVATIVGTKKGEIIKGTAKADVIVARGGHDKIYGKGGNDTICAGLGNDLVAGGPGIDRIFGQPGRDRLYGGPGPDFLAGQLHNDTLVGGIGVDTCFQGPGTGLVASCERPLPPPPPPPPPKVLVRAYSDLNGDHLFNAGDVMISQLVDTNGDGLPSAGDTIEMGMYPVVADPTSASQFLWWGKRSHIVTGTDTPWHGALTAVTQAGPHSWQATDGEVYAEGSGDSSRIADYHADIGEGDDSVYMNPASPSQPASVPKTTVTDHSDSKLIDVEFYY